MRFVVLASLLVATASFGCTATGGTGQFGAGGSSAGPGGTGAGDQGVGGANFSGSGGSTSAGSGGPGCTMAATLVYVLSDANDLYSFDPPAKKFTKIGGLGCNTAMQPNSMAIDRDAVAWVNYVQGDPVFGDSAGAVFKVSTTDASCQPTQIQLDQGWFRLGMGFSSDTAEGATEKLFITGTGDPLGGPSPGLGRIDLKSSTVVPVGQFTGQLNGQNAELTGTGDARLFGFFTTTPVEVAELDKSSGKILSEKKLPKVETPAAWAFSFWGGDFYLYTSPDPTAFPNRTTNVTKYHPQDGSADTAYMTDIGFRIVGAGVSTCAPIVAPK